jgi:2-polyprenyl-6-methoxyphenol hydroxylase-like FAD-dependent oxidoreductase
MSIQSDVVVVGAGPTGLMLAGDLAATGVSVTVLERRLGGSTLTRAFALHCRTLELFDMRGIADEVIAGGTPVDHLEMIGDAEINLALLPSRFPFMLLTPQYATEAVLARRAKALGAEIVQGAEFAGLRQDAHGVDVEVRMSAGGTRTYRAAYVVGADGANSAVRNALRLPFPGRAALRSVMLADVKLASPPARMPTARSVRAGIAFVAPLGDGWHRIIAWDRDKQMPASAPLTLEEVASLTRQAFGTDFGIGESRWLSRFQTDERQVPRYHVGRVVLAGDAAHVHSPAGGQGMNTGIQDAANLSWRLVNLLRGAGGPALLDGYQDERHPIGRQVVRDSGMMMRTALIHSPVVQRILRTAARTMLRLPGAAVGMAVRAGGLAVRYPAPRGGHRRVGSRVPDLLVTGPDGQPQRLFETLRGCAFVLVTPDPAGSDHRYGERLVTCQAGPESVTMLIRPDGYVAWAAENPGADELSAALQLWLGQG